MGKYISNNDFLSRIKSLVGNEYTFLEKYRGALTKILCQHNSCGLRWNIRPNDFYNGHRCPNCSKRKIKNNKDFGKEIQNLVNKEYLFLEEYKGRNIKIKCRHNICNYEWNITPNDFINNNVRCPKCNKKQRRTDIEYKNYIKQLVDNEYIFLDEFVNTKNKMLCLHKKCGKEFRVSPNNFIRGTRCPFCKTVSKGETKIRNFLENNKIEYEQHKVFSWSDKKIYDFYLPKYNLIIEYNGVQHYKETNFFKVSLKEQQRIDLHKRNMAENHNIKYLIIPYTNYDNLEELLINKLFLEVK